MGACLRRIAIAAHRLCHVMWLHLFWTWIDHRAQKCRAYYILMSMPWQLELTIVRRVHLSQSKHLLDCQQSAMARWDRRMQAPPGMSTECKEHTGLPTLSELIQNIKSMQMYFITASSGIMYDGDSNELTKCFKVLQGTLKSAEEISTSWALKVPASDTLW